jgi:molybdate transport system permease protein
MDWIAFKLSLKLAAWTLLILIPIAVPLARLLASRRFHARPFLLGLVSLPLVLPPTVLGFYLLTLFGMQSVLGQWLSGMLGQPLVFTFAGLLLASVIFNLPFAVLPAQRAFEAIPPELRDAAWVSGLSDWRTFWRIELPLAWPGILAALLLTFAHTLGEFGVVLMVGGNIPGETRTLSIAIYDRVQAFDETGAAVMSVILLFFAFATITAIEYLNERNGTRPR